MPERPFGCCAQTGSDPFFGPPLLRGGVGPPIGLLHLPPGLVRGRSASDRRSPASGHAGPSLAHGVLKGFTLIEMMIVIGIIVVLVAIALPTAFSMLKESRIKQTRATMSVLETAIEQFMAETPFKPCGSTLRSLPSGMFPPTTVPGSRLTEVFLNLPPSPTTAFAPNPLALNTYTYNPSVSAFTFPATMDNDAETVAKFVRLLNIMKPLSSPGFAPAAQWRIQRDISESYSSIECLWFALKTACTSSEKILDRLPPSAIANLDKDFAYFDANANGTYDPAVGGVPNEDAPGRRPVDLMEVLDAWKKPLRYAIREAVYDSTNPRCAGCLNQECSVIGLKWELRSAGDDEEFSLPFTDADQSDDVILQGP